MRQLRAFAMRLPADFPHAFAVLQSGAAPMPGTAALSLDDTSLVLGLR